VQDDGRDVIINYSFSSNHSFFLVKLIFNLCCGSVK